MAKSSKQTYLKVAVVILNYKVVSKAIRCIESVRRSVYPIEEIVVVDNSPDDSGDSFQKTEGIYYIPEDNLGYTGGNNAGIRKTLEKATDYIFILNPDAFIEKDTVSRLVDVTKETGAEILGPKVLFEDKKTIWYAGGIFDPANVLGSHRGVDEKDCGRYEKIEEVDYVTGAALFVKREVFEKIGLFDNRYFMYYEDSDFCFRAKRAGFKVIYVPQAVVYHENAQSAGLGSRLQDYYITRNRLLFAGKFLPFRTRFALFREAVKNIFYPVRRKAFFDFLVGNFGKGNFV